MYKIISDNRIIDVVDQPKFIRFLPTGHIALTDKANAHGIVGSDGSTLYSFMPVTGQSVTIVTIEEISETEFSRLSSLLNSENTEEARLAAARATYLSALSEACKNKIIEGFTLELSDGKFYNFRLTTEDQLNLILIENQLLAGDRYFVYHATNQPCKVYEKEDMARIVHAFRKHIQYHTTYYNAVKQYINSLSDINVIANFVYGTDIAEFIEDELLKQILKSGGIV